MGQKPAQRSREKFAAMLISRRKKCLRKNITDCQTVVYRWGNNSGGGDDLDPTAEEKLNSENKDARNTGLYTG